MFKTPSPGFKVIFSFSDLKQLDHDHLFNINFKVFKSHVRSDSDGNTIIHLKQRVNHKLTKQSEL